MKLIFESDKWFNFFDFHTSHKQLLIRGEKVIENDYNIDLVFEGVVWMNSPTKFDGIKILQLEPSEINGYGIENQYNHRIFMIITEEKEYFIKTGLMRIYKNRLKTDETSIDLTGRGQEELLWMSND